MITYTILVACVLVNVPFALQGSGINILSAGFCAGLLLCHVINDLNSR